MSKKNTPDINPDSDKRLENCVKDDEQEPPIIDAPDKQPSPNENDDLESYLKKNSSGSRAYGIKGQGW